MRCSRRSVSAQRPHSPELPQPPDESLQSRSPWSPSTPSLARLQSSPSRSSSIFCFIQHTYFIFLILLVVIISFKKGFYLFLSKSSLSELFYAGLPQLLEHLHLILVVVVLVEGNLLLLLAVLHCQHILKAIL